MDLWQVPRKSYMYLCCKHLCLPREENLAKIARRVKDYKVEELNPPREGKRLLVLDVDYTLFGELELMMIMSLNGGYSTWIFLRITPQIFPLNQTRPYILEKIFSRQIYLLRTVSKKVILYFYIIS